MKSTYIYRGFRRWLARRTRAQLRFWGAFSGFVLAQGAPVGLLLHTFIVGPRHHIEFWPHVEKSLTDLTSIYFYVWVGSTVYFMAFGFAMAALMSSYWQEYRRSRNAMILFSQFDQLRTRFQREIQQKLKSPAATIEEFIQGINEGLFGDFGADQKQTLHAFLGDLLKFHQTANENLAPKSTNASLRDLFSEHQADFEIVGSDATFSEALAVEPNLFRSAFHEIFLELQKLGKVRVHFDGNDVPSEAYSKANWPRDQFVFFSLELARNMRHVPEEWSIVRHIVEWYGGGLWILPGRLYFVIPKSNNSTKKTEAA